MSQTRTDATSPGLGYSGVASKWGWFVALGLILMLMGIFALGDVVAFTLVSVIFIGAMLIVGGIFQIIHAFMTRAWRGFALNVIMGVMYAIGGVLIMDEPLRGSVILTLFVLAALLVGGVMRMVIAFRHWELTGWWLMLLGGVISVFLAVMLYATLPWSGLWVLGTLIAIELLTLGVTWLRFGFSLRRMVHSSGH
jgi:uncharacterized membrane protein HdeD (DUF308 family)